MKLGILDSLSFQSYISRRFIKFTLFYNLHFSYHNHNLARYPCNSERTEYSPSIPIFKTWYLCNLMLICRTWIHNLNCIIVPEKKGKDDHLPEIRGFTDPSRRRYKGRELRMDWSCVQGGSRRNHEPNGETCSLQSTPDTRNPNQVLPPTTLLYLIRTGLVSLPFFRYHFSKT